MKTVARVAQEMLEDPNLSERTRHIYAEILRRFLNFHGYRDIAEIGRADIKEFLSHWEKAKHKTFNLSHSVINRLSSALKIPLEQLASLWSEIARALLIPFPNDIELPLSESYMT